MKEDLLEKINKGEVQMRPKAYFVVRFLLLVAVTALVIVISIFLISYILFSLQAGGNLFLLGFGARGLYEFVVLFPWTLFLIDIILLLFLDWLIKNWKFGYNRPVLYLFFVTLGAVSFVGIIVNLTPFHGKMMMRAESKKLPLGGGFYDGLRKSHQTEGIFKGKVVSIEANTFTMIHNDQSSSTAGFIVKVIVPSGVNIDEILSVGDNIFVAGDVVDGEVMAYGVHKF